MHWLPILFVASWITSGYLYEKSLVEKCEQTETATLVFSSDVIVCQVIKPTYILTEK